jgi:hypothetical protein
MNPISVSPIPNPPLAKKRGEVVPAVQRINVTEPYSIKEWSTHFGCTPAQLRAAVTAVGNVASEVEIHLRSPNPAPRQLGREALAAAFEAAPQEPVRTDGAYSPPTRLTGPAE